MSSTRNRLPWIVLGPEIPLRFVGCISYLWPGSHAVETRQSTHLHAALVGLGCIILFGPDPEVLG